METKLSAVLKEHGWNCFGFGSSFQCETEQCFWRLGTYIKSEVSDEMLNKYCVCYHNGKNKGNNAQKITFLRKFLNTLKFFFSVTLGPQCQFQLGCFWVNCLPHTEQIINSSPLFPTSLGGVGFCIYMSKLSQREPDPWRTATPLWC